MLVIGAGGLVLQMLDDLIDLYGESMAFWTDQPLQHSFLDERYSIIGTDEAVKKFFTNAGPGFILGIGNPQNRIRLCEKFEALGGSLHSFLSPRCMISRFSKVENGAAVLSGSIVEAGVVLGKGVLINIHSSVTHEARIGAFTEIGPGVTLAGKVTTGRACFIGAGATIIPRIVLGNGSIVGAGSLVIGNVGDQETVVGVPAKPLAK